MKHKSGPNGKLISLIIKKTKIKRSEVVDVLKHLPECMFEAFLDENSASGEQVHFGFVTMNWMNSKMYGYTLNLRKSRSYLDQIAAIRKTSPKPLAQHLQKLHRPINTKTIAVKPANGANKP